MAYKTKAERDHFAQWCEEAKGLLRERITDENGNPPERKYIYTLMTNRIGDGSRRLVRVFVVYNGELEELTQLVAAAIYQRETRANSQGWGIPFNGWNYCPATDVIYALAGFLKPEINGDGTATYKMFHNVEL